MHVLEHSIGDLAIHFVTWILGGKNLLIHYTPPDMEFVPFSIGATGVWGPAATRFFAEAAFYNHYNNRDIDRYHWSSEKFLSDSDRKHCD